MRTILVILLMMVGSAVAAQSSKEVSKVHNKDLNKGGIKISSVGMPDVAVSKRTNMATKPQRTNMISRKRLQSSKGVTKYITK